MTYVLDVFRVRTLPGLGDVLTTAGGFTPYVFEPDGHQTVSCTPRPRWP